MKKQNPINLLLIKIYIKKSFLSKMQKRLFKIGILIFCVLFFQYFIWYLIPHVFADEIIQKDGATVVKSKENTNITTIEDSSKWTSFWQNNKGYIIAGITLTIVIFGIILLGGTSNETKVLTPQSTPSASPEPQELEELALMPLHYDPSDPDFNLLTAFKDMDVFKNADNNRKIQLVSEALSQYIDNYFIENDLMENHAEEITRIVAVFSPDIKDKEEEYNYIIYLSEQLDKKYPGTDYFVDFSN